MSAFGKLCLFVLYFCIMLPLNCYSWATAVQAYWVWFLTSFFFPNLPLITKVQSFALLGFLAVFSAYFNSQKSDCLLMIKSKVAPAEDDFDKYYRSGFITLANAWAIYWFGWVMFHVLCYLR